MADPLSIAASIAGLIALSTGLLKLSTQVQSILKDEPAELVLKISKEIELLCAVLSHLQASQKEQEGRSGPRFYDTDTPDPPNDDMGIMPFITSCNEVVKKIGDQLILLQTAAKCRGIQKLFSAVSYKEKVKQLENLRNDLEISKTTLTIYLTARSREVTKPLKDISDKLSDLSEISNSILDIEDGINKSEEYRGLKSFEEWIESFAGPDDAAELEAYRAKKKRQREGEPSASAGKTHGSMPPRQIRIDIEDLKGGDGREVTESIIADRYAPVSELIKTLHSKGYNKVYGLYAENEGVRYGDIMPRRRPIFLNVTSGQPSYSEERGFLINSNQKLIDYFAELTQHQASRGLLGITPAKSKVQRRELLRGLEVSSKDQVVGSRISIKFQRTLRTPDDGAVYDGNTDFGAIQLFKIPDFKGRIPESMARKGGYFFPLFQREAITLDFEDTAVHLREEDKSDENFAIKVFAGSINIVNGLPGSNSSGQDHIIVPKQRRLNGFQISDCIARQLVAMPSRRGYSLEKQMTGTEFIRGIQLMIASPLLGKPRFRKFRGFRAISDKNTVLDCSKTPAELGFENSQIILDFNPGPPNRYGISSWFISPKYSGGMQRYGEFLDRVHREAERGCYDPDDYTFMRSYNFNGKNAPKYHDTLVNDLLWHHSNDRDHYYRDSTVLKPILEISFHIKITRIEADGSFTTTSLESEIFHPFLDISDFVGIMCGKSLEIAKRLKFPKRTQDTVLEINGFHVNSILEAYNPQQYTPITDIALISQGGTINIIFYPIDYAELNTRYRSGYGISSVENMSNRRERARRLAGPGLHERVPELCLGIRGLVYQEIEKDAGANIWDWNNCNLVNIQIIDAAFFQYITGITAVSRVPLRLLDQKKLAKRIILAESANISNAHSQAPKTITQIDAEATTEIGLYLNQDNADVGCACCEVNFSDTLLRSCNHVFCLDCIQTTMTDIRNRVTCDACGALATGLIPYASTMELPPCRIEKRDEHSASDGAGVVAEEAQELEEGVISSRLPYTMKDSIDEQLKRIQAKYTSFLSSAKEIGMTGLEGINIIKHISILAYFPDLFASEIREFRKLPLQARVFLLSEFLTKSNEWTPLVPLWFDDSSRGLEWGDQKRNDVLRLINLVRSLISLVPNIDDFSADGDLTRIKKIFHPENGEYYGNFFGVGFDIVFEWVTSGSKTILELGLSLSSLMQPLLYWGRQLSIEYLLEHLEPLLKDPNSGNLCTEIAEAKEKFACHKLQVTTENRRCIFQEYSWFNRKLREAELKTGKTGFYL
ncbi:hypothetical protein TWF730_003150 [Orbilia blumenaviensis]|uniref:RING-type domain-containing protein n=1 Tax=Orbilia blumenaviensis TaxID=1796055 RepID=A0AAV9U7J4_9PEZI